MAVLSNAQNSNVPKRPKPLQGLKPENLITLVNLKCRSKTPKTLTGIETAHPLGHATCNIPCSKTPKTLTGIETLSTILAGN